MKGPRSRHRFNVKRIWECPACKKRAFEPPQVTARTCDCQGKDRPTWMCLIDPTRPRVEPSEAPATDQPT